SHAQSNLSLHDALPIWIVQKIVGDCRSIAKVVVLVQVPYHNTPDGVADAFYLCYQGQNAMFYLLEHIILSIRPMKIGIFGGLVRSEEHTSELQSREKLV